MELTTFLLTVIASITGTVIGIVVLSLLDKAYGLFK